MLKKLISITLILAIFIPLLVDARAGGRYGGGSSGGYRGTSYRSQGGGYYRPNPAYTAPAYSGRSYANPPAARSSSGSFFSGMASGLLGAWLYNKMFHQDNPTQSRQQTQQAQPQQAESSGIWRIILILGVAFLAWRFIQRRRKDSTFFPSDQSSMQKDSNPENALKSPFQTLSPTMSNTDYAEFENIFRNVQEAWSQNNLISLQRLTTPEMYDYFASIIKDNQNQNISNHISDIKILALKPQDTWVENQLTYARVMITWSAIDYAVNNTFSSQDPNYLVAGSMDQPTVVTEVWTFRGDNGRWLLAGVQE